MLSNSLDYTTVLDSSRAPASDALTELLREGARELIYKAVQSELEVFLEKYSSLELPDGRKSVFRNDFLPSAHFCLAAVLERVLSRSGQHVLNGHAAQFPRRAEEPDAASPATRAIELIIS